jgi:hypothetical protein
MALPPSAGNYRGRPTLKATQGVAGFFRWYRGGCELISQSMGNGVSRLSLVPKSLTDQDSLFKIARQLQAGAKRIDDLSPRYAAQVMLP